MCKREYLVRHLALTLCLFTSSVNAVLAEDGFYLALSGQRFDVDVQGFDDDKVGAKLYGGWRFGNTDGLLDYIAVEASFQKSGDKRRATNPRLRRSRYLEHAQCSPE